MGGDLPSIMMIILSIGFFLSSVYMANSQFEERKEELNMHAALVDATSAFLKENAKIRPIDLEDDSEFWSLRIEKIEITYSVQTHVKILSLDPNSGECIDSCEDPSDPDCCASGILPPDNVEVLSKRFPIALEVGNTGLEVYPALVKVSVFVPT